MPVFSLIRTTTEVGPIKTPLEERGMLLPFNETKRWITIRVSGNFRRFRWFRRSEIFLSMEFWKKKLKFEWISNFPLKLGTFYPIKFRQWKQINQCISDFENYILNAFPTFMNCVLVFFKIRNLFIFITTLITKKRNTFMNCLLVVFKVRHLFNFITTLITYGNW